MKRTLSIKRTFNICSMLSIYGMEEHVMRFEGVGTFE